MTCITYLVTGANRGLGKAIVAALLLREEAVVVAAVRDPNHGTATSLHEFPQSRTAKLLLVKIDASSSNDQKTAINELKNKHGVETLDVVIGNAGIIAGTPTVLESTAEGLMNHYQINAINTVLLYQAVRPSLLGSKNPRFIVTSGSGGSIAQQDKIRVPLAEYGPSRAAVNWLIRKVHFEEERISTVLVDPGLIDTETGDAAVTKFGADRSVLQPVEKVAENYLRVVDAASKETTSGTFISAQTQEQLAW